MTAPVRPEPWFPAFLQRRLDPFNLQGLNEALKKLPLVRQGTADLKGILDQVVNRPLDFAINTAMPGPMVGGVVAREMLPQMVKRSKAGGFTFDPRAGAFVERGGYMVGGVPGQKGMVVPKITPKVLESFAAKNEALLAKPGMMVGSWWDPATKQHYLDVSQQIPKKSTALKLLKERGEKAAFHLDTKSELTNLGVNAPALRLHRPGQKPVIVSGKPHTNLYMQLEDRFGSLIDESGKDLYTIDHGFLANDGSWLTQNEAFPIAKKAHQLTTDPKQLDRMKRTGNLYSEGLR